ncbi:DNA polymerase-3 subunit epsilon [Haloferula luteola]|uniref:DNA polymerase-3 subunit epsilon n=1 Tax=Haloferula luteola TaxID=595692 RepID=A0A840V3M7_9BACT|nr:DNA polymerase-3 subunit epsilon [Haloferula luteola]
MPLSSKIRHLDFTAIDFESAGSARGKTDAPVQVGLACWSMETGHHSPYHSYLRTDRPITWSARKVHGIRDEDLLGAPSLQELWPTLRAALHGAIVVAHGMGTEKRFLRAFPGHSFGPWIDTLLLTRAAFPELPSHALSDLCETLGLSETVSRFQPDRQWHDALFDATASLVLLEHLLTRHELADRDLEILLHPNLTRWSAHRRS